jgi:hypothetical protein
MSYEPPIKVFIPLPSPIPIGRGVKATGDYGGNLRVRCTNSEYDLIQQEAQTLGLSLAGFSRWCIFHAAKALHEHRESASTDDSVGDTDASTNKRRRKRSKRE